LIALVITNIKDVRRLLFACSVVDLIEAISEPCLGVPSKLVGILGLQNLSAQPLWGLHGWIIVGKFFLKLLVFLLGVPVPLIDLLKFKACIFSQLLKLKLSWLTLGIFVALLEGLDLIATFSVSLEADECRSILRILFENGLLFYLFRGGGSLETFLRALSVDTHYSSWHKSLNIGNI